MGFDRNRAASTPEQLDLAQAADQLYEMVQDQLHDEDPGVIDFDDVFQMLIGAPESVVALQTIIQAVANSGGGLRLGALLAGAGSAFLNDNLEEFVRQDQEPQ